MKTNEKFYGAHLAHMETVKDKAVIIAKFAAEFSGAKTSRIVSRIKSPESMEKKILADDGSGGFLVSVQQDSCVNEIDADGEEYLVDFGQEWSVPVKNLSELNGFIKRCEEERLWNYLPGPVFRMKPDIETGILYVRGQSRNFVIGEGDKGLYVDESANTKNHNYKDDLLGITRYMTDRKSVV